MKSSRRQFLKTSAVAAGGAMAVRSRAAWALPSASVAINAPLSVFGYSDVQLLESPLREQFDRNHDLFLHMNEDAMLKPFRQRGGLAAPGPDMGGWYDNADDFTPPENFHAFIPGHSFGQYLSGLSRAYAVTGSKATQEKVHRLEGAFAETVEPSGKFYLDSLAEGQNVLPGEHAYSHVNAFSSAMQAYLVLGEENYLRAATNGLRFVHEQGYATGGWGPDEAFVPPRKGLLEASLGTTHSSFETPCGAYGHFKITRYLLRVTRDSRYGDSMERVLYNTIGGATPILADGTSFYYSDYNHVGRKLHYRDKWPCCSGTFPQLTADYGISSYYRSDDGVYVNLFIPSRVSWAQNNTQCTLTQRTEYPRRNATQFEFALSRPETFTMYIRIPEWAGAHTMVSVNGRAAGDSIEPGKFLALKREWKDHDRIELEI